MFVIMFFSSITAKSMNMLKLYKQPPISDSSTCQNVFWKLSYPVCRFFFVLDVPAKLVEIGKKAITCPMSRTTRVRKISEFLNHYHHASQGIRWCCDTKLIKCISKRIIVYHLFPSMIVVNPGCFPQTRSNTNERLRSTLAGRRLL